MMRLAWILAWKDLRLYFRDRTALLMSLALPILLATIFGFAMGGLSGGGEGVGRVKVLVEDLDASARSQALVESLAESPTLRVVRESDVRRRVADGKAAAALLVPSGYGADLDAGRLPRLKLFRDPGKEVEQQILAGSLVPALFRAADAAQGRLLVERALEELGVPLESIPDAARVLDQGWTALDAALAAERDRKLASAGDGAVVEADAESGLDFARRLPALVGLDVEDVVGGADRSGKLAGRAHAVSGIAVMMLLFGLAAAGGTILLEQGQGTLQRLMLSPAPGAAILLGKFLVTALSGGLQLLVLFVYGGVVFGLPIGRDPLALAIVSVAVCAAATSLGILLAVTCRTQKQLEGFSTLIILAMSAIGGSWFPLVITPGWYQKLGHFTLNAWAMDAYQGIFWYQKGLSGLWLEVGVLLGIALVLGALAVRGWNRRFGASA